MYHSFPKDEQSRPLPVDAAQQPTGPGEPARPEAATPPLSRRAKGGLVALIAGAAALAVVQIAGGDDAKADAPPPPTVTVAAPLTQQVVEWDDYTGRFEASQAVEIRPRVSGQLVGIHFRDGEVVRRGQLLFTIDPRPYVAALAEARGRLAAAQAALALARSEHARAASLIDDEAVSREEVESLAAAARTAEAQLAAAQAVVRQRELDVEFTRVRAPISGRISDRRIDRGNLVAANETVLTSLLSLDPIHFTFDGSEALYLRAQRERQAGRTPATEVEIRLQDEAGYAWRGRIDFTDNAIDPGAGTIRARAVVDNPDYFLAPGMFGNMRLAQSGPRDALLVPDAAVQTDQARKIVLAVERDGTVAVRPVELGARVGTLRVIRSGLRPNDRGVVEGVQYASPGSQVNVRATRIAPPAAAAPAQAAAPAPAAAQATIAS